MPMIEADPHVSADTDARLLLLAPGDNVLVVTARIRAGEAFRVGGGTVTPAADLPLGHKVARRAIRKGEKITKYGAPIGSAVADIGQGEHVHVHNHKTKRW